MFRLFFEAGDAIVLFNSADAETVGFLRRYLNRGQGDVGIVLQVPLRHRQVIHLLNRIRGQNQHQVGRFGGDGLRVLVDGVGGAAVPVLSDALHRRQNLNVFTKFRR
jgi:hypothetical protein